MSKEYTDAEMCLKCVDENEILYDESSKYLDKITSMKLDCPETLYEDILKNLPSCKDVLSMSVKQRIIMNESGVRLNAKNDITGMQAKIADMNLSTECKNYLRDISIQGYKILKECNFFDYLVEFDAERSANVKIFGKKAIIVGGFDMLAILDEKPLVTSKSYQTKRKKPLRKIPKTHGKEMVEDKIGATNSKSDDVNDYSEIDSISEATITSKSLGKAALTVIVTARNYINTLDIFRQFLFMYIQNLSRFFFLVLHVGPLVEKEEIVLYEYHPPKSIVKFVKSFQRAAGSQRNKTEKQDKESSHKETSGPTEFIVSQTVQKSKIMGPYEVPEDITETYVLDVSQLEVEFRKVKGRHLQQAAPLRDYFRYVVYDCPGVKDHRRDNKARYNRYITKQEKKRNAKLAKAKLETEEKECEQEPTFTFESSNAAFGSTCLQAYQSDCQSLTMEHDKKLLES